ncbi:succinylglutamate desuccinylase [Thalassotalea ponticola]|uniref:succinylglutamate desuccinylase n=1 Tax=Thalassotalea ponticola TaxID=1523392 RepID=UPI0025B28759|nr:succinylglutamate desuccinylase [Thalassotalea ponticola]MDN3652240.1 succinylglutamate desuccinylase [Thalassotalea ponticola]
MSELKQQLLTSADFLALTRANPDYLAPFSHTLSFGQSQRQVNMHVLDTGVVCFEPAAQTTDSDIVLSCAVHGNETAPIEICQQLIEQIINGQLPLTQRVLFLFGNPPAINLGQRFVEENLNRLFSGAHSQGEGLCNAERRRAKALEQFVADFFAQGAKLSAQRKRLHYDLHTAIRASKNDKFAVYPYLHGEPRNKEQLQFLLKCGINTVLLSNSPTTTFSYFSARQFGAHAFTVELGKVRPFGENDMENFADCQTALYRLLSGQELQLKPFDLADFNLFKIFKIINREQQDFVLHFAEDAPNFSDFEQGYLLATDGDQEHRVTEPGEAIIFPNADVAIGQRALLTVIPCSLDE